MNSIKMNSKARLPSGHKTSFFKTTSATGTASLLKPLWIVPLGFGLFLSCSLTHAADQTATPEQVTAATANSNTPLHEHSSVEPQALAVQPSPNQPAPTSVPEQSESVEAPEQDNKIVIVSRPQVTGLWAMTIPGAQCIEYYNFMEKGDVVIKSGAEWTYGKYVYQVPAVAEPGSPVLALRIQYDNLQTDCSGNAIDQRGEDQQQYVKWTGPSSMDFCTTQDGAQCFASLRRILP
ncbi:hypothetical protein [Alkanindiges illinoisensis]|uniref:hypothetical protein n=1 Tax=Alkanindiges illinoisensis TaxID=197183 RepID=UPI00068408DB|nr:hypothetical protein [Alkanindiges illinoisensis]